MSKQQAFVILTRIGFVARGLLYLAIGALVLFLGRAEGADGALKFIGDGFGHWILVVIGIGFAAYGLWRITDTILGTEHPGGDAGAIRKRIGAGVSGIVHLALAYQTAKIMIGAARASEGTDAQAEMVLQLPGGQALLFAFAVGVAIAGLFQLNKGASCSFLCQLVPEARESAVKWLGRIGYFARGIVFLIVAYYVFDAALNAQAWKAGGTEQVFAWLSRPLSLGLAAGLILFGLYGLVEAWFRRIHAPDIDRLAAKAAARF